MKHTKSIFSLTAAALLCSQTFALDLSRLKNTGFADQTSAAVDSNYMVDGAVTYVADQSLYPITGGGPWYNASSLDDAAWITHRSGGDTYAAPGVYKYGVEFNLLGADASFLSNFSFSGDWSSDNGSTVSLYDLNSATPDTALKSFNTTGGRPFESLHGFTFDSSNVVGGFKSTSYLLEFEVNNALSTGSSPFKPNPTGLLVANLQVVPEPATVLGSLFGLGMIGYVGYRRRKSGTA